MAAKRPVHGEAEVSAAIACHSACGEKIMFLIRRRTFDKAIISRHKESMAEKAGFEPAVRFKAVHTLSRRAP